MLSIDPFRGQALRRAYEIRLYSIKAKAFGLFSCAQDYGPIIHEFDPWFNYRATEYLAEHGWHKPLAYNSLCSESRFFTWFDHMSWYPLGRPVATTIYPGMQITSVLFYHFLRRFDASWDLNKVCCFLPAWGGALSAACAGLLAAEASPKALAPAAWAMALVPAHLARSVGGGFDNEATALPAMCLAFVLWCRALRTKSSWPIAALAGLSYSYMAACWGGYIFALRLDSARRPSLF